MFHVPVPIHIQGGFANIITVTVESLNKGHIGDNINSVALSFIERLSSFRGSIGHIIFGTSNSVLCREVYYTVSLFQRVHYRYRRFHCTSFS